MKQINQSEPRRRGRPKKEGQLKQSSVRIRPALHEKLTAAAGETGQSIASELESRLERTFSEAPMREATSALLQSIAWAVHSLESGTNKPWDQNLTTWAMVREILANGPVLETIPHPDPVAAKELATQNAMMRTKEIERTTLTNSLARKGFHPSGMQASLVLGAALEGYRATPDRDAVREAINAREDIPDDFKRELIADVDRIERLDAEIDQLRDKMKKAIAPYMRAREAARRLIYESQGIPDLPIWLTAPLTLDEPPPRQHK